MGQQYNNRLIHVFFAVCVYIYIDMYVNVSVCVCFQCTCQCQLRVFVFVVLGYDDQSKGGCFVAWWLEHS